MVVAVAIEAATTCPQPRWSACDGLSFRAHSRRASAVDGVVCKRWFLLRVMATVASWLQSPYSAAVPSIAVGSGSRQASER